MTDAQAMKPADAFAELGRIKFAETDFTTVLAKLAGLAQRTIPGDEVTMRRIPLVPAVPAWLLVRPPSWDDAGRR